MTTSSLPEGWGHDPADPSVGIFGEDFWHDACPVDWERAGYDFILAIVTDVYVRHEGEGLNRYSVTRRDLRCPACDERASYEIRDWDPDETDEERLEINAAMGGRT